MNVLVFDIETVPDVAAGRRLYGLELGDEDVARVMIHRRREESGQDFLRHYLHKVVAISVLLRRHDECRLWSLGDVEAPEAEIIGRFFEGIDRFSPTLVSWNGSGFDLPVLHYRALLHKIPCARYWETGDGDSAFRFNNYLSRYHARHTDVMDVLAGYQARATVPLDELSVFLGFPGKQGHDGAGVWDRYRRGEIEGIRHYCETDVLNTYLVFLRLELMRGHLMPETHRQEEERLKAVLAAADRPHLAAFLSAWEGA
ncbi:3'-5' exonuclease [Acidiferrobacter sp.]|uniref:3'-5' exonuclease n=1 Tax=Acidiferrobacter sp. TaxID=1872107 RepID=UPI00262E054B|nr:3'-5' exonuclease [Acidiferrobacter sp.]